MINFNIEKEILGVLREDGELLIDSIIINGDIHRVPVKDKPKQKDGAYVVYGDEPYYVLWWNWHTGKEGKWTSKMEVDLTPKQRKSFYEKIEKSKIKAREERKHRYEEAAQKANRIYIHSLECTEHSYLDNKKVKSSRGLKVTKDHRLIVPIYNKENHIVSLQFIDSNGDKRFLSGGQKEGCYFHINASKESNFLLVVEGMATGLSLNECLEHSVFVAFDAGNLLPVAKVLREHYPDKKIILCADNDIKEDDSRNVGIEAAKAAALEVDGYLAIPKYKGLKVDWNDLHCKMGVSEVRNQFMAYFRPEPSKKIDTMPKGYSLRPKSNPPGLWHTEYKENGEPIETWLGPLLYVEGMTRDENGSEWGLLLKWEDDDSRTHTWAMPKALLESRDSSTWRGRLASEGWSGAPGSRARKLLADYFIMYKTDKRILCVPRTGWHKGCFIFPNETICEKHKEEIVLQPQPINTHFVKSGFLEDWQSTIGKWAKGNSRLIMAICASLASPLLELTGQESGGFNFIGHSSIGKTTALIVAGSIWGKGSISGGYIQNWRATSNGLEGLATLHSDTTLCLDEISQAPGRTIMEASYMLANGTGKARASKDGTVKSTQVWRCMILSTGEKGLAEKIADEGGRVQAGQEVRLIDIPANAERGLGLFENLHGYPSAQIFSEEIKRAASQYYGCISRAFISHIQKNRKSLKSELLFYLNEITDKLCLNIDSNQVRRVARRFALCIVAGGLISRYGLLSWSEEEVFQAIQVCFNAWIDARGNSKDFEEIAIVEQCISFINTHGSSRFQFIYDSDVRLQNRAGFYSREKEGTFFYIFPNVFKEEICKGYSHKEVVQVLYSKKFLLKGDSGSYTSKPSKQIRSLGVDSRLYRIFISSDDLVSEKLENSSFIPETIPEDDHTDIKKFQ